MAAVTSPARHAASLATSASSREPRRSKVHRAMEWLKPSSAPSSVTMSASVPARMQTPSCTSYRLGSLTTTRFTRTRHSDIVHPLSSSQLTETRDCVRSFGGYNIDWIMRSKVTPLYDELRSIEREMDTQGSGHAADAIVARLDQLDQRATRLRLPTSYASVVYMLRSYID